MDEFIDRTHDVGPQQPERIDQGRRLVIKSGLSAAVFAVLQFVPGCKGLAEVVDTDRTIPITEQRERISRLNKEATPGGVTWNNELIVRNLTEGLDPIAARRKLFEFVQSFPYQLRHHEPNNGTELYDSESGDCRHKREALYHLFSKKGFEVRKVTVFFDWADLPIPKEILAIKKASGTKSFHSAMEVKIDGQWVYVDPTWDPALEVIGFPVTTNWDGKNPTKEITNGEVAKYTHDSYETLPDLYSKHHIPWPVLGETVKFNDQFNAWLASERTKK